MKAFNISTHKRTEFVNITDQVAKAVADIGIKDGVVMVFVPHTTAGVTINDSWLCVLEV